MVSILVPSSTFPNQHPFFSLLPASSPRRALGAAAMAATAAVVDLRFLCPKSPKWNHLTPPLPPHALDFVNGGRKRRLGGAQRARAHGGAEDRDDVPVPFHEAVTPPSMYIPSRELIKAYGPCCPVVHPAQEKQRKKNNNKLKPRASLVH